MLIEIVDHRLLANGFSAGARMCPGSRVANLELELFLIEMIRNFKWTVPEDFKFEVKLNLNVSTLFSNTILFEPNLIKKKK